MQFKYINRQCNYLVNPVYYNRPCNILDTEILFRFINVELALLLPPPSPPTERGIGN